MNLTVIVPYWNGESGINRLVESIPANVPVVIIDDHSDVPLQRNIFPSERDVTVVRPQVKGYFTGAVNVGLQLTRTDVLILNQDSWLEGAAALDTIYQHRGRYALIGERIKGHHPAWPDGYIHGTFMFIRRDAIDDVGYMDAKHFPLWGSTADYQCRLARRGYDALVLPEVGGFVHQPRQTTYGEAITEILEREPHNKGWFIRTPPLISVVITCYNYGRYLSDAVNSLIGGKTFLGDSPPQTFQGFEIIIVDDGSTDESYEIAAALANNRKGIHVLRRPNGGTAAATNTGIEYAKGKYIAILAGDDMMHYERLEKMLTAQEANPHSFIYDDMTAVLPDGRHGLWKMQDFDFNLLLEKNHVHAGILFPKKAWREVGGYPEIMREGREDWAFNVGLGAKGWCGVHLRYAGYIYRRAGQNRTLKNTTEQWRKHFKAQLRSLYPRLYQGERDPMCCGSNASTPPAPSSGGSDLSNVSFAMPGSSGMPILEYRGGNMGETSWWGEVTGTQYRFGGKPGKNRRRVDARDVPGFTKLYEGTRQLFVVVPEPKYEVAKPAEAVVVVVDEVTDDPGAVTFDTEVMEEVSATEAVALETDEPVAAPQKKGRGRKK
jgi:glycosyltransferase involved in cell wall biosynthesis